MEKLEIAAELRAEADKLEKQATRKLPKKWRVGQRVRFLEHKEWAWSKGSEATVVELSKVYTGRSGDEYQVFWTSPDGSSSKWWTTPDDVELIDT